MSDDIQVSVSTLEAAAQLTEDFEEVVARVNGDLMSFAMQPTDPISVEAAVAYSEQCIDRHLAEITANSVLLSLAPELKQRFRSSIEAQARSAAAR